MARLLFPLPESSGSCCGLGKQTWLTAQPPQTTRPHTEQQYTG